MIRAKGRVRWWRTLRVTLLLIILLLTALTTWHDRYRSTRWREPLFVGIYPITADDSPVTRRYVDALREDQFAPIDAFFSREALRYRLHTDEPVRTRLRAELTNMPPSPPERPQLWSTVLWSLRLRYWAWSVTHRSSEPVDIRIFVLYHDPALTPTVPHSLGLTKGLIGVVYAFATPLMNGDNDVVIAHELLHTLGASDKYDPSNDAPRFPEGYGDPHQVPLYPQTYAELMAGRRMLTSDQWRQASSLDEVVVGPATAAEIRWPR